MTFNAIAAAKRVHPYGCILGVCFLVLSPLFCFEYATDTYTIELVGLEAFSLSMFANGRLITGATMRLFAMANWSVKAFYAVSFLLALICSSVAVYRMQRILQAYIQRGPSLFFSFLTVFNPCAVEYFLFIEKGFFMLAVCASVCAAEQFQRFLNGKRSRLVLSLLFLTVAAFTYQVLPGAFVPIAALLIVLNAVNIKQFVLHNCAAILVYGGASLLNYLFITWFGHTQRAGGGLRFSNLSAALFYYGVFPTCLALGLSLLALLAVCICIAGRRGGGGLRWALSFFQCCYLLFAALAVTILPFLFTDPSEVWLPCRILYPFGMSLGILPAFLYDLTKRQTPAPEANARQTPEAHRNPHTAIHAYLLKATVLLVVTAQLVFFEAAFFGRLRNNRLDRELCLQIGNIIAEYESETGNEITTVSIYHDSQITKANPGVLRIGDTNVRAFSKSWSDVEHMNVLLHRNFAEAPPSNDIYQTYFSGKDWSAFHRQQLVFVQDALHLCVY